MTRKEVKEWLESYRKLKKERSTVLKEIDELIADRDVMQLRSPSLSGMPHSGQISDPTANAVLKYESTLKKYAEKAERLLDRMNEISDALELLPADERLVLHLYYISGLKNWRKVGETARFSESYCWALAGKGITELSLKLNRP